MTASRDDGERPGPARAPAAAGSPPPEETFEAIGAYWSDQRNNEIYLLGENVPRGSKEYFDLISERRYRFIYYFPQIERFFGRGWPGQRLLEVGCGMGLDLARLARLGYEVEGIDLAEEHIALAKRCFEIYGVTGALSVGNAERLEYGSEVFDRVYSYGVLHHTPDTAQAIREIHRVLRRGGRAFLMLYNRRSLNNLLHFLLQAPFENPRKSLAVARDAPVTHRFVPSEVMRMCEGFSRVTIRKEYVFGAGYGIVYPLTPAPLYRFLSRTVGWHLAVYLEK